MQRTRRVWWLQCGTVWARRTILHWSRCGGCVRMRARSRTRVAGQCFLACVGGASRVTWRCVHATVRFACVQTVSRTGDAAAHQYDGVGEALKRKR
eukprot:6200846-Pleurochrysis_carterae.AAC.2